MQVTKKKLMDKMGVGYELGPYETCPWMVYDESQQVTCSAEVRAGIDEHDMIEAQIDMLYDQPAEGQGDSAHIFRLQAKYINADFWTIDKVWVKGKPYNADDVDGWQERACDFFAAVAQDLKQERVPDIDQLIEDILFNKRRGADQYGGGGGKKPKIEAQALLNPKGRGF